MIESTSPYPTDIVRQLRTQRSPGAVTATLTSADRNSIERVLNSFLNCCLDVQQIGRFILFDTGLPTDDQKALHERYGFLEFHSARDEFGTHPDDIRPYVDTRFWLKLAARNHFFAPDELITRLIGVFASEPEVYQVGLNFADADQPVAAGPFEASVRHTASGHRYVMSDNISRNTAMYDLSRPMASTATLDQVVCVTF
jgi:hypothetical protein